MYSLNEMIISNGCLKRSSGFDTWIWAHYLYIQNQLSSGEVDPLQLRNDYAEYTCTHTCWKKML